MRYPVRSLERICYVLSELKINCDRVAIEIGTKQNILAKSVVAKYLLVADWMESVISIILDSRNERLNGWNYSIKVVVICGETPYTISKLKNKPNWTFKRRNSGGNHAFTQLGLV